MATIKSVPGSLSAATPPFPEYCDSIALGTAAAESWTVPAGVKWVIISVLGDAVWVKADGTAVVPTDVSDGTAPFAIPANGSFQIEVPSSGTLSFIRNSAAAVVSIACWNA